MSAVAVRRVVIIVCVTGIAGMIVSSIRNADGAALTFGLVSAVAVLCLIVATSVERTGAVGGAAAGTGADAEVEQKAAEVERLVTDLVATGVDEAAVRALVGASVRLGKAQR